MQTEFSEDHKLALAILNHESMANPMKYSGSISISQTDSDYDFNPINISINRQEQIE